MVDIVIVSFPRDYEFLYYCLKAIRKFCTGYHHIILVLSEHDPKPEFDLGDLHLTTMPQRIKIGYINQQIVKMRADLLTFAEHVCFIDSDIICTQPTDLSKDYFDDGKPQLWYRTFDEVRAIPKECTGVTPAAAHWQHKAEKALGTSCPYFTMEFQPILHHRETLALTCSLIEHQHGMSLEQYANSIPHPGFSEFITLGNTAISRLPHHYSLRHQNGHRFRFDGYLSYTGVTDELKRKFEELTA